MKMVTTFVAAGAVLLIAGLFIYGRDAVWEQIAGPADLGPVEFATLEQPPTPNHYLVCPEGFCAHAQPDKLAPVYELDAARLQAIAGKAWSREPRLEMVAGKPGSLQDRYVQRTAYMRFPDTISVRFFELENGKSTLAIYSRSQIGRSDLGVNMDRVLRWISLLNEGVQRASAEDQSSIRVDD
jgi:uncharacterized protein (DUF1499 family)